MAKPKLHNSQMEQLWSCGWKFKMMQERKEPWSPSLVIGASVHDATAECWKKNLWWNKATRWTSGDAVWDVARDTANKVKENQEVLYGEDDTPGSVVDEVVELVGVYGAEVVPTIAAVGIVNGVVGVEWPWVLTLDGLPYDLAGQVDLLESKGTDLGLHDTKTAGRKWSKQQQGVSQQMAMYNLAVEAHVGKCPEESVHDVLVRRSAKLPVRAFRHPCRPTKEDRNAVLARIGAAIDSLVKGVFQPANSKHWSCSAAYCGFWRDGSCPFAMGRTVELVQVDGGRDSED